MQQNTSLSEHLRKMTLVYFAQCIILATFGLVVFYLNQQYEPNEKLVQEMKYLVLLIVLGGVGAAHFVPHFMIRKIDTQLSLREKISKYFSAVVIRSACLEASGLFACVLAFISGANFFLVAVPVLLFFFFLYRPSKEQISTDLNLNGEERRLLD